MANDKGRTMQGADVGSAVPRPRRFRVARSFFAAAVLLGTGCAAVLGLDETSLREGIEGGIDGSTPAVDGAVEDGASNPDGTAPQSPLSLSPASLVVRRGGTATFTVTLTRTASTPSSVSVTIVNLPAGVIASTATIASGQSSATVTVTASANAALGAATVRAASSDAPTLEGGTASLVVAGAPGSLDTTFDTDGLAIDATKGVASAFYALAVQADGKILAGGLVGGPGPVATGGWLLRRFEADGKPDTAFNNATTALPVDGEIRAIALDAQQRIVCVGTSSAGVGGVSQLTAVRVGTNGAVDTTFAGGAARVPTLDAPSGSSGLAVALGPNGEIYAVGSRIDDGGESGIITRFSAANGARDPAFNGGALRVVEQNRLVGVAPEGTTGITVGGTDTSTLSTYFLGRIRTDGGLDNGFGTFGTSTFAVSYRARAFTRLPNGALVLVGDVQPTGGYTAGLATPGGASIFARGFGTAAGGAFYSVASVGSAGFVAAGHASGPNGEAKVMRILLDGGADDSFSANGTVVIDPGGAANGFDVTLFATALQSDGRVLVAGNRSGAGAVVYRLWP